MSQLRVRGVFASSLHRLVYLRRSAGHRARCNLPMHFVDTWKWRPDFKGEIERFIQTPHGDLYWQPRSSTRAGVNGTTGGFGHLLKVLPLQNIAGGVVIA